jgi:hypothetical protein
MADTNIAIEMMCNFRIEPFLKTCKYHTGRCPRRISKLNPSNRLVPNADRLICESIFLSSTPFLPLLGVLT